MIAFLDRFWLATSAPQARGRLEILFPGPRLSADGFDNSGSALLTKLMAAVQEWKFPPKLPARSRRINDEHRIVYSVSGDVLMVAQVRNHY